MHRYENSSSYPSIQSPRRLVSIDTKCFEKPTNSCRSPLIRRQFFNSSHRSRRGSIRMDKPKQSSSVVKTRISHRFKRGSIRNSTQENWQRLVNVQTLTKVGLHTFCVRQINIQFLNSQDLNAHLMIIAMMNNRSLTLNTQLQLCNVQSLVVNNSVFILPGINQRIHILTKENDSSNQITNKRLQLFKACHVYTRNTLEGKCYPALWQGRDTKDLTRSQGQSVPKIGYTLVHDGC